MPRTSRSTVHDVVHENLKLRVYKLRLAEKLQENISTRRYDLAVDILSRINEYNGYLSKVCFGDEATFQSLMKFSIVIAAFGYLKILMFSIMNVINLY
jgi:hypothetical protein